MARIAILSIDLGGHLGPALRLGATLARGGHAVLMWAPEKQRERVEGFGGRLVPHQPAQFERPWRGFAEFAVRQAQASAESLPEVLESLLHERIDLVAHDTHTPWGRLAADFLGLPRLVSNPLYPAWSAGVQWRGARQQDAPRWDREHGALRASLLSSWGVDLGSPSDTLVSAGDWTIAYTTPDLIGAHPAPEGWCLAGPLMDPQPRGRGGERPFVYAALGTFFNRSPAPFRAIIEALGALEVEALVSTGGALAADELGSLPANVTVRRFVDSRATLARAAVHVSHGGGGSVHESLLAGVPLVCLPLGADQWLWSRRAAEHGAAEIGTYEPAWIAAAITRQLSSKSRRAAQILGRRLAAHPGPALVLALTERILASEGGSPPGRDRLSSPAGPG
jgi:MGT family glycosyltransferase